MVLWLLITAPCVACCEGHCWSVLYVGFKVPHYSLLYAPKYGTNASHIHTPSCWNLALSSQRLFNVSNVQLLYESTINDIQRLPLAADQRCTVMTELSGSIDQPVCGIVVLCCASALLRRAIPPTLTSYKLQYILTIVSPIKRFDASFPFGRAMKGDPMQC